AESDSNISEQEKQHIASIASYLGINAQQLDALSDYAREAAAQPAEAMGIGGLSGSSGSGGILDQLGLGQKLQNSGINISSLTKGLIGIVGPMILGNMLNKRMRSSNTSSGMNPGGGLGSLIGSLSGGKGLSGLGGLLSGFLK
ncbi:MAG: hypothetical protein J7497_13360, partial [Chitinophagaceae bacterium]|nr:hypothetical protein [Chitinophagaceae bacterium]